MAQWYNVEKNVTFCKTIVVTKKQSADYHPRTSRAEQLFHIGCNILADALLLPLSRCQSVWHGRLCTNNFLSNRLASCVSIREVGTCHHFYYIFCVGYQANGY